MSEATPATESPNATLIARASKTVRNKNLILIAMFLVALGAFAYDGFYGYPLKNDLTVKRMLDTMIPNNQLDPTLKPVLERWPKAGWNAASHDQKTEMDKITQANHVDGFHSELDIHFQQLITAGLLLITLTALWWFFHCQRRRVIADEHSLSPAPGISIPWAKIQIVDNTIWKKKGYVFITYADETGAQRQAKLDDYIVDRAPLIEILNRVEQRAAGAEFLPKSSPEIETT